MTILQVDTNLFFDSNWFKGFRAVIEILYLISAPLLLYLAFRGLEQIKLAKSESNLNSKREAFKVTAERCEHYQHTIIPLINIQDDNIRLNNVKFFADSKVTINGDNINILYANDDTDIVLTDTLNVINSLESFSLFFVQGLGNEKVAYDTLGTTFLYSVEKNLPIIVGYGQKKHFKNLLKLFLIWHQRDEKEKLELEKMQLEKKLSKKTSLQLKHLGEQ